MYGSSEIRDSENDGGGNVRGDEVYKGNREKLVLASLSDSYSELEVILLSTSGPFSYPILHCLLTTYFTDCCSNKDVNNFDLRKSFYSKQDLKNTCYSLV